MTLRRHPHLFMLPVLLLLAACSGEDSGETAAADAEADAKRPAAGVTINPTTGDYSRGASGVWIENGERAWAVNECTIAGNLRDMLKTITPANDARDYLSRVVPSVLVEGLTLAGN